MCFISLGQVKCPIFVSPACEPSAGRMPTWITHLLGAATMRFCDYSAAEFSSSRPRNFVYKLNTKIIPLTYEASKLTGVGHQVTSLPTII